MKRKGISISIHIPIYVAVYVCDVAIRGFLLQLSAECDII